MSYVLPFIVEMEAREIMVVDKAEMYQRHCSVYFKLTIEAPTSKMIEIPGSLDDAAIVVDIFGRSGPNPCNPRSS